AAFNLPPSGRWPRTAPEELTAALVKAIDDENPKVRLEAVYALGVIGRSPVAAADAQGLIKALDHYDPAIRAAAADVIGRLKVTAAGDALIKAINDSQAPVRYSALQKLGQNYAQRMVDAMTSSRVIPQVQDYLLELGPSVVPAILPFLQEPEPSIRLAIADVLGFIGGDAAVAPLQAATQDRDPDV